MPGLREDQFIYYLRQLSECFPEYADTLELLIEQIKKGKQSQITALLQLLKDKDEDWL